MSDENQEQDDGSNILGALGFTAVMSLTMLGSYATYYLAEVDSTPFRQTEAEKRVERRKKSLMSQLQEEPYDELKKRDIDINEDGNIAEFAPTTKSLRSSISEILESGFFTSKAERELRDNVYSLSIPRINLEEVNGTYHDDKIVLNIDRFTYDEHYNTYEEKEGHWDFPTMVKHRGGYIDEAHPEFRCSLNHTLVHEMFHDLWDKQMTELQREEFTSAMMQAYRGLDEKKDNLREAGTQIAGDLNTEAAEALREFATEADIDINYKKLFKDKEYGEKIGNKILNSSWDSLDLSTPQFGLMAYVDSSYIIKGKNRVTDPTQDSGAERFRDQVLEKAVQEIEEVQSLSSYRVQKDIFEDKLPLYKKEIYGGAVKDTTEYFLGVEGYAFLGEYIFRKAMDKGGSKEIKEFLESSGLDKFYSDYINFD